MARVLGTNFRETEFVKPLKPIFCLAMATTQHRGRRSFRFNHGFSLVTYCFLVHLLLASGIKKTNGSEVHNRRLGAPKSDSDNPICDYSYSQIAELIEGVKNRLVSRGFTVRDGRMHVGDSQSFASNPGNPYYSYFLDEEIPFNPNFKLNATSAVLFVGCTPSDAKYFSFRSYAFKANSRMVFASLGDSMNHLVINTTQSGPTWARTSSGAVENPHGKLTAVVTTADGITLKKVATSLKEAGVPQGIVNLDAIPSDRVDLFNDTSLELMFLHRANSWTNEDRKKHYFDLIRRVLVIDAPPGQDFSPIPEIPLREQGTGKHETEQPGVASDLAKLHDAVVSSMELASYKLVKSKTMTDKNVDGFECLEKRINCKGDNRDANYLELRNYQPFKKKDIYWFVGTNYAATGKTVYTSIGLYQLIVNRSEKDQLLSTNITVDDSSMENSASAFGIENNKLIAYAMARKCNKVPKGIRKYCVEVGYDPDREIPSKSYWGLATRTYLEPETKTAPLVSEIVMPQFLKFQPLEN